jgi:hypothetical protein
MASNGLGQHATVLPQSLAMTPVILSFDNVVEPAELLQGYEETRVVRDEDATEVPEVRGLGASDDDTVVVGVDMIPKGPVQLLDAFAHVSPRMVLQ